MRRSFIPRLLMFWIGLSVPAWADENEDEAESGIDAARSDIQRDAQRLGKSAGVKAEVLEGRGGYGSAGCGLGSVVIKPSEHFTQIFAATTNGLFGNQTFGITSGTSNCDGPPRPARAAVGYVLANRNALALAAARGRGESLDGLATLADCRSPSGLGRVLQRNFGRIFPDATTSDLQVARAMLDVMRQHSKELGCATLDM